MQMECTRVDQNIVSLARSFGNIGDAEECRGRIFRAAFCPYMLVSHSSDSSRLSSFEMYATVLTCAI